LKIALHILLNSQYPMFIWWGPELTHIYNDAYMRLLGERHPKALGRSAPDLWADVWPVIGPQAEIVMREGRATWNESFLLLLDRHGFTEESYFTYSHSPVPDDAGKVGGVFCAVTEDTARVLSERRLRTLRDLGERSLAEANTVEQAVTSSLISINSRPHVLSQFIDLTERKRAEEEVARLLGEEHAAREVAEQATRAKDEFLALVSHELRSPLNSILGWNRLLRSQWGDEPEIAKMAEIIEANGKAQLQLIEDLLDTARIISGKMKLEFQPVELVAVISAALDAIRPAADSKGVKIDRDLDPKAGQITGDPDRLQQLVWNLASNAVKFTPSGGHVQIELRRSGASVEIVVRDTGQGISSDLLPYVFDRFKQGDSASSRRYGGIGLGLALVKHLAELHGGSVAVESPGEGQGATFTVTLPVRAVKGESDTGRQVERETAIDRRAARKARTTRLEGVRARRSWNARTGRRHTRTVWGIGHGR
jgi:signal transduction histidine kinase